MADYARVIGKFNQLKGTKYQFSTGSIQIRIDEATRMKGWSELEIMEKMKEWENDSIREFLDELPIKPKEPATNPHPAPASIPQATPHPAPASIPQATPQATASMTLGLLEQAIVQIFTETKSEEIMSKMLDTMNSKVAEFIAKEYGPIQRKVEFDFGDGKKASTKGIVHEKFEQVLAFVQADEPVFLYGPAGSGKNVICKQIADVLGLDFYFSNAVTQEYKITGFTDAMGTFHESQFYKAFKNGGIFMLDEMDASIPEVLIILNSAIANRYFDFPAPIGYVEAHDNFRIVAAGNTYGTGASYEYTGRNQLDMASLDRFAIVEIDYSKDIELACAQNDEDLVQFIRDFRRASKEAGVKVVASYRSIERIAKMMVALGRRDTLKTCLTKGMEADDINMILSNMRVQNAYTISLREITQ